MAIEYNWDENEINTGPCAIWVDVTVPDPSAIVPIDPQGRPSTGLHLGYTRAGARITIETAQSPFEADQSKDASRRLAWTAGMMIEASLLQTDIDHVQRFFPSATLAATNAVTFGGAVVPNAMGYTSMLVAWRLPYGTDLWTYCMIYYGRNTAPANAFQITRTDAASIDFQFRALPLTYRPRTDYYGHFYNQSRTLPLVSETSPGALPVHI